MKDHQTALECYSKKEVTHSQQSPLQLIQRFSRFFSTF